LNRSFVFGSGFRLKASARLRLAYAFQPRQFGFFGNSGDFGNFLYLLWLLGVWLGIVLATSLKMTTAANRTRKTNAAW
jgi:hypothetical protein